MRTIKKVFAMVLVVMLAFSVPETVFAAEDGSQTVAEQTDGLVSKITLNKKTLTLNIGKSATLKATVAPVTAKNKKVTWSVSNEKIATVSSKGVVTAKNSGSCKKACISAQQEILSDTV